MLHMHKYTETQLKITGTSLILITYMKTGQTGRPLHPAPDGMPWANLSLPPAHRVRCERKEFSEVDGDQTLLH